MLHVAPLGLVKENSTCGPVQKAINCPGIHAGDLKNKTESITESGFSHFSLEFSHKL